MARVVVRAGTDVADALRQSRLSPLQRLALALFIATEHQRLGGRIEIKPDDIPKLGFEVRVTRQFERAGQVGLDLVGRPNALHTRGRKASLTSHRPHAPAGPMRRRLRCLGDDLLLLRVGNRRLRPATPGLLQSRQTVTGKPPFPANHRRSAHAHGSRCRLLPAAFAPQKDNPRPGDHALRRRGSVDHAFQFAALPAIDVTLHQQEAVRARNHTPNANVTVARSAVLAIRTLHNVGDLSGVSVTGPIRPDGVSAHLAASNG